ncbi:MAG: helix-hairpin-helix domain-containing protein, partial [bacterium]
MSASTQSDSRKRNVVAVLEEMSLLLDLTGANPFRSRAYANGARAVQSVDEDLAALVEEGRLDEMKGIGKGIAAHVAALLEGEPFEEYEKLKASVPEGLLEMLRVPGLGAKKVRALWTEAGITTPEALEAAAREGRLRGLAGFGPRSEEKVLEGIAQLRRYAGRFLWPEAFATAVAFE